MPKMKRRAKKSKEVLKDATADKNPNAAPAENVEEAKAPKPNVISEIRVDFDKEGKAKIKKIKQPFRWGFQSFCVIYSGVSHCYCKEKTVNEKQHKVCCKCGDRQYVAGVAAKKPITPLVTDSNLPDPAAVPV